MNKPFPILLPGVYGFRGEYRFLSNFYYPAKVMLDGEEYQTVEHAYQAAKSTSERFREEIRLLKTPGHAKRWGRTLNSLREDWNSIKVDVMLGLLRQKFQAPLLKEKLLATEELYLEETNTWGDTFWGICNGNGQNMLGLLLMKVRKELQD